MKAVYIVLLLLMLVFISVQYNDPDGPIWMVLYAIPAIWTAIAAFWRSVLGKKWVHWVLLFCVFLSVVGMIYFWPRAAGWWRQEVWWEVETAREGMGMMIIAAVLLAVWFGRPGSGKTREVE